ncbi:MAG: TRAP transporter small permease [Salipiger thiooxidans]|jgi:TRAP-type C4-dicarboxylate transport system permease small subunit|uniref:TRAP transporter small permease n=1 Tax=Salipiger thiooxidans TaxID=282683 RepID=UPI001A8ECB6F|nr:TRAP transporter small permease [Salipiger thiooxidans]MBN8189141.1 TRAP transporter small permease [Salipiger thiooxidans]MBR9839194.1 TRAP transporter small permease [Paracoccaceae bacterium]
MSSAPAASATAGADYRPPVALRALGAVSTLFGVIAALMILASVLITCHMIFVRGVLGQSTIWQTEAVIYLMIGATLLGLPYVQKLRGHVGVDLLPHMLPSSLRRPLAALVMVATILMVAAMVWYGWEMFHQAWRRGWKSESVWAFPLWITYLSVPLGFGLYLLQLLADLWLAVFGPDTTLPEPHPERSPD